MSIRFKVALIILLLAAQIFGQAAPAANRPRAREAGLSVGVLPTGPLNAITDVAGVLIGQTTIIRGENIRTGVTAILPHGANMFQEKVPGAVFVGNGFGKLAGSTQVNELGEIETPIILTSTLAVPKTADHLISYMLSLPGNENVQSINPLVAETNDGFLNDIRGRHIALDDVVSAIRNAKSGAVDEGATGAGTGTIAFGWKGGIGTSSRKLPANLGGYTVGILVQTNFGGVLSIDGVPIGKELGKYYLKDALGSVKNIDNGNPQSAVHNPHSADGSIIIVIATDAPLDHRQLDRLAERSMSGLARTGSAMTNGSGDYAIAFSTASESRIKPLSGGAKVRAGPIVVNDAISPLFLAVIEATEEAIYNSLFRATTVTGKDKRTVEALPLEPTLTILRKYGRIK